ncbi:MULTISPECIES: radical SAM protein [Pseudoalteromonas]|uniref:radical SAM protein n=1 Tax=Pseudoalteromonas TaxID=53246 RepID=UPI0015839704|nr:MULTISPECIES: radical SAM protein [Pseudoalteromonas]MDI4654645.1 radical SAM protein [Pseudoalteromonas shioyasakiensis]NUJ41035.1 radical SAM protein [Pseudoalteromonas sp. 0303]
MLPNSVVGLSRFFEAENVQSLEIVLKLTERCNIECTYCYYFFGGDESYKTRAPTFSKKNVDHLVSFLERCIADGVTNIRVVLHGGEPLLLKKDRFSEICERLTSIQGIDLALSIQTNAMLIDDDWIAIFSKYNIFVGVSIDGPEDYNDLYRIDKQGKGTYQRVVKGIDKLLDANKDGLIQKPGVISVINPDFEASVIYEHLTKHLDLSNLHFLYPDDTYSTTSEDKLKSIQKYSDELLNSWASDTALSAKVRFIDNYIKRIQSTPFSRDLHQSYASLRSVIITVDSNGDIGPEDTLRSIIPDAFGDGLNIKDATISDITSNAKLMDAWLGMNSIPSECGDCEWKSVCRGGDLKNRYDEESGSFNNKSIYCTTIKSNLESIAATLYRNGMPIEQIEKNVQCYSSS